LAPSNYELWVFFTLTLGDSYFPFLAYSCFPITTPQKPIRKAYEQRPAEVGRWMEESYPAIAAQAKAEKAEIYWGDETGIATNGNCVRGYAPAGKTPELRLNA